MISNSDGYEGEIRFPGGAGPPISLRQTVEAYERRLPDLDPAALRPIPTGFPQLDENMGGGLRGGDLVLLVGKQNVGKTLFVSQMARNIALWAAEKRNQIVCLMICYEHDPILLQQRLLCMESWRAQGFERGVSLDQIQGALADMAANGETKDWAAMLLSLPRAALAGWRRMQIYLDTLFLYQGDPTYTSPEVIDKLVVVLQRQGLTPVVMVDYAQRVPPPPELAGVGREAHVDYFVRAIKSLALRRGVAVIAVGAVDEQALRRRGPVHLEDLWGPATMSYEPDCAWVLNHDQRTGEGDDGDAQRVRLAIEKNRQGPSELEWCHELYGSRFWLDPKGRVVRSEESYQGERTNFGSSYIHS